MDILKRIHQHSLSHPDRLAVISGEDTLTWKDLDLLSGRLAAHLKELCGSNHAPVAVYGHKNPLMLICFLACVRSGRAYCPIDISVPDNRTQMILDQMDSPVVLATEPLACDCRAKALLDLDKITALLKEELPALFPKKPPSQVMTLTILSSLQEVPELQKEFRSLQNCLNHYLDWSVTLGTSPADKEGRVFLNQAPFP